MTPWTQILHTELADVCMDMIEDNKLTYHNLDHVEAMYQYLADTNEDYDEALDWAVLCHDLVYDHLPDKEARSAEVFIRQAGIFDGCVLGDQGKDRVVKLILATQDHRVLEPYQSPIVRADLSGLADPVTVFTNYGALLLESKALYRVDERAFAENNIKFMKKLKISVAQNKTKDWQHAEFYSSVQSGINMTINISKMLTGYDYGEI